MPLIGDAVAVNGSASLHDAPVAIVRWPEEIDQLGALEHAGRLRLVLVSPDAAPPAAYDSHMDWIRLPASDDDIRQRVVGLQQRARQLPPPRLDEHGILWRDPLWVCLAPVETRLLSVFLDRPGQVCSRQNLAASGWPDGLTDATLVTAAIKRIRPRIAPLGLAIRTVRKRGYFLEVDPVAGPIPAASTRFG